MFPGSKGQEGNGGTIPFSNEELELRGSATEPPEEGKYFKWEKKRPQSLTPMESRSSSHQEEEADRAISAPELLVAASYNDFQIYDMRRMFNKGMLEKKNSAETVTKAVDHEERPAAGSSQTHFVGKSNAEPAYQSERPPAGGAAASDEDNSQMWEFFTFPDDSDAYEQHGPLEAHDKGASPRAKGPRGS